MISSNDEVLGNLYDKLDYSSLKKPLHEDEYHDLSQDYITKIDEYFNRDMTAFKRPLHELQSGMYSYLMLKGTSYEPAQDLELESLPALMNDITQAFYQFIAMSVDNETFYNSWVYEWIDYEGEDIPTNKYWRIVELVESDDDKEKTKGDILATYEDDNEESYKDKDYIIEVERVVGNPLLDSWIDDIKDNAKTSIEVDRINSANMSLADNMVMAGSTLMWEDNFETVKQPNKRDIAKELFIERGLMACYTKLKLPIKIPTYLC